jgi:hypothetical protein
MKLIYPYDKQLTTCKFLKIKRRQRKILILNKLLSFHRQHPLHMHRRMQNRTLDLCGHQMRI